MNAQQPIRNLRAPVGRRSRTRSSATRDLLEQLNQLHADRHPGDSELLARMEAYRLAARMQLSAPEVTESGRANRRRHTGCTAPTIQNN